MAATAHTRALALRLLIIAAAAVVLATAHTASAQSCDSAAYVCRPWQELLFQNNKCSCCATNTNDSPDCEDATPRCIGVANCVTCVGETCTSCTDGYTLKSDGTCAPTCLVSNCEDCKSDSQTMCETCLPGYTRSSTYTCVRPRNGAATLSHTLAAAVVVAVLAALAVATA